VKVISLKIIILEGGNKLVYKNKDEYTIKTAFGNFPDVNEAIKEVPSIKESKNVKKCEWCGRYFLSIGNRYNRRKTCSEECSIEFRRCRNRRNNDKRKLLVKHQNQNVIAEYKRNKGLLPTGFNQIDSNKTMGETILWKGIPMKNGEYDWEQEARIIRKLKRDIYKRNIVNH